MSSDAELKSKTIGVIPARHDSTRLFGKPLMLVGGRAMIERTYFSAKKATLLDKLVVATDNDQIASLIRSIGGEVVMTSSSCPTGTDRVWDAVSKLDKRYEYVVNIQGDQPLVDGSHIDAIIRELANSPDASMSAAAAPIPTEAEATNYAVSKVVFDKNHYATYYSRSLIPSSKSGKYSDKTKYYKNCGMYCFRYDFLKTFNSLPVGPLQATEDLEQLKAIENGYRIKLALVSHAAMGVDTQQQLDALNKFILENNLH